MTGRDVNLPRTWVTCPACQKKAYPSKRAAKTARRRIGEPGLHVYECPRIPGTFHLGHMRLGPSRDLYRTTSSGGRDG